MLTFKYDTQGESVYFGLGMCSCTAVELFMYKAERRAYVNISS